MDVKQITSFFGCFGPISRLFFLLLAHEKREKKNIKIIKIKKENNFQKPIAEWDLAVV
ncbi:hypothetical protein [Shimazuella soli]|uniref:hypothetical protein n=1 Tax=Shimazuella soli TaxID=1892854 RepID=UPI001F0E228B|nr:hypothetical protein [Shimazuella soli]